jgi:hypothetical protein
MTAQIMRLHPVRIVSQVWMSQTIQVRFLVPSSTHFLTAFLLEVTEVVVSKLLLADNCAYYHSQFSPPTDVLQRHWNTNGHPQPPIIEGSLLSPPGPETDGYTPPRNRSDYTVPYRHLLDIAQDYLFANILLDYGFLNKREMDDQATEAFDESLSVYPD